MTHPDNRRALRARIAAGLAAGIAVAAVDDLSIGGEVGPIVIVGMLLAASAAAGAPWGHRGAMAAAILWACLPLSHVGKHVLNMPDTLHPNTFASILNLAAFSLVVAAIGTGIGLLLHSFRCTEGSKMPKHRQRSRRSLPPWSGPAVYRAGQSRGSPARVRTRLNVR